MESPLITNFEHKNHSYMKPDRFGGWHLDSRTVLPVPNTSEPENCPRCAVEKVLDMIRAKRDESIEFYDGDRLVLNELLKEIENA